MEITDYIKETPWDARTFGIPTFEITRISEEIFNKLRDISGHFTVRIDPLSSKKLLHDYGFYYCDTLIEPYCTEDKFLFFDDPDARISHSAPLDELMAISHGAFLHGRFHRDFNIDGRLADLRYDRWLEDLYRSSNILALLYRGEVGGFWGVLGNKIVLHALGGKYRGKGLAKSLWSVACQDLFQAGHREIVSSISASNVAVLNLYASLGFRFRNPVDVYHFSSK